MNVCRAKDCGKQIADGHVICAECSAKLEAGIREGMQLGLGRPPTDEEFEALLDRVVAPRPLHVFHVQDAGEYWIAHDTADVQVQRKEMFGDDVDELSDPDIFQLADDYILTISDEDEDDVDATREKHTCAEWCAQEGRGLLAACEP